MENQKQNLEIQILQGEYNQVNEEIRLKLGQNTKIIAFGLTIIGIIFSGIGVREKLNEILSVLFIVLPIVSFSLTFYIIHMYDGIASMEGYRANIAKRINDILGKRLLISEKEIIEKFMFRKFITWVLFIVGIISLNILIPYYSLVKVWENCSHLIFWVLFVAVFLFCIFTIVSIIVAKRRFRKVYEILEEHFLEKDKCSSTAINNG